MKVLTDLHTHTGASSHGFSTIIENATYAAEIGMQLIAVTNHGPALGDGAHAYHFKSIRKFVPDKIKGVTILCGAEANIISSKGELDLDDATLDRLDIVIAGCHKIPYMPEDDESFLSAYKGVINNKRVHILGHLCRHKYYKYLDEVIKTAVQSNKLIEINNNTLKTKTKPERIENLKKLIEICKKYNAKIVINSDAHFAYKIGDFDEITKLVESFNYPEHLIINRTEESLIEHLKAVKADC